MPNTVLSQPWVSLYVNGVGSFHDPPLIYVSRIPRIIPHYSAYVCPVRTKLLTQGKHARRKTMYCMKCSEGNREYK
jgi:hypothetical protein